MVLLYFTDDSGNLEHFSTIELLRAYNVVIDGIREILHIHAFRGGEHVLLGHLRGAAAAFRSAGAERQEQHQSQNEGNRFFHFVSFLLIYFDWFLRYNKSLWIITYKLRLKQELTTIIFLLFGAGKRLCSL